VGVGQPRMKWNQPGLDAETGEEAQEQHKILNPGFLLCKDPDGRKAEGSRSGGHPDEPQHQQQHGDVRLDEVVDAGLEGFGFFRLKDDHQEGGDGHQFPEHQKYQGVLNHADAQQTRVGQDGSCPVER